MATGLQVSRWLCLRWPLKELQHQSVGDVNAGSCGGEGGGVSDGYGLSGFVVAGGAVSAAEQS